ncbi:MAG TPA: glycosyltransferase [Candidatus Omnitrophota bacterium]|nr:glycosyltransferase [Candidatus Omnitrophota bacterium]HPS37683.1 glycosyltransferase [Candidatus Omnitrophota bacterium]
MSEIDFIISVKDQLDYTRRCIESIFRNVSRKIRLILIDDASADGTPEYFDGLKRSCPANVAITVIRHDVNQGYLKSINEGLSHSDAPHVIFSNNDVEVFPGAVEEMIAVANLDPRIGLVNPNSNEFDIPKEDFARTKELKGRRIESFHAAGFFMMVKREVIRRIGGFDEIFSPGYFEEMDYSERGRVAGFSCVIALGAYVFHYGSRTFLPEDKQRLWDINERVFVKRWRGDQWFAYVADQRSFSDPGSRKNILGQILRLIRDEKAYFYVYLDAGLAGYLDDLHVGIRPKETPLIFGFFSLLLKCIRSARRKKPISRIYVSDRFLFRVFRSLRGLFGAEVVLLPR